MILALLPLALQREGCPVVRRFPHREALFRRGTGFLSGGHR